MSDSIKILASGDSFTTRRIPNNYPGRAELQRLIDLARRYGVIVVSDEIHADFLTVDVLVEVKDVGLDVLGPVVARRDALVVPQPHLLPVEQGDGLQHLLGIAMGIADEQIGPLALVGGEEFAHCASPPVRISV